MHADETQKPASEVKEALVHEPQDGRSEETDKAAGSTRPFTRLVTTSAVAAALAEVQGAEAQVGVERPKRRRIDRRHSGMEPLVEAEKQSAALQLPRGHRTSAPTVEPTQVMTLGSTSPRGHLKRATSTHLAGIRERLKSAGQVGTNASVVMTIKRTTSASTTPTFRAVAKAVAVGAVLASGGAARSDKREQGQNYEQMMARFQLRRLEPADQLPGRSAGSEVKVRTRRSSTYLPPVDSDMSQRRADDLVSSTRPRSEGEVVETTAGRGRDRDGFSSQSRADSRPEESPRRPGAPSMHASTAPQSLATVLAEDHVGPIGGGSVRSLAPVVTKAPSIGADQELALTAPQGATIDKMPGQQQSATRQDSAVFEQITFRKARVGSRPRPFPRLKKQARVLLTRLRTPMSPFSRTARLRSSLLLVAFCVHTLGFPYEVAFHSDGQSWFISADVLTEMAFLGDFLLTFNTSFVNKRGVLVVSRRHIAWNFLTGACLFQLIAALPVMTGSLVLRGSADEVTETEAGADAFQQFSHTLLDIVIRSHRIVHLLRLLGEVGQVRDARIDKSVLGWLLYSRYSHLLRIVWIVGAVMLIAHGVACCWRLLLIDAAKGDPSTIVARTCGAAIDPTIELEVYADCFYMAMQMLQGQSLTTTSTRENVFAACVNLLGSIVLAVIFGHVAMLVANFNANSTAYQRKMESVFAGMTKMQLPAPLRERIHQYYAHLWREYEALDGAPLERFAKELSHNLTLEVVLFKYMELAMHVPFWEKCSPDFQKTLVLSLDTRVYLPDDFVVRRGEVGDEFYMINRGMCELVGSNDTQEHATEPLARRRSQLNDQTDRPADTSTLYTTSHDGTVYPERDDAHRHGRSARSAGRYAYVTPEGAAVNASIKTLTRGQAFGEMALLMNYQRTANVRAMTYVEMCVLSRTAFQAVLTRYPADRKHVISQILTSSLENNERFGIPCPLTAMVRSVFAGEIDGVASGEDFITPRRAAKLIAWAVNPDVEDDSIKFALSSKLEGQLLAVRDQEFGAPTRTDEGTPRRTSAGGNRKRSRSDRDAHESSCTCHCNGAGTGPPAPTASPARPDPEVESQVMKLESVQGQALALIQELQRGVQSTLYPPEPVDTRLVADASTLATDEPPQPRGASSKNVNVHQRRLMFVRNRSTSAPNFVDLDATAAEPSAKSKPVSTSPKPIQRAVTARWLKTSESSRPLRGPSAFAPLVRSRAAAGSSSHRFIQRMTNQLASLTTSSSSMVQASPTRYADQLFGTAQPSANAPSLNETSSYREDSTVSIFSDRPLTNQ